MTNAGTNAHLLLICSFYISGAESRRDITLKPLTIDYSKFKELRVHIDIRYGGAGYEQCSENSVSVAISLSSTRVGWSKAHYIAAILSEVSFVEFAF